MQCVSTAEQDRDSGLSFKNLLTAAVASAAAAILVRLIWEPGALIGAALTPVLFILLTEALKKPADLITARASRLHPAHPPPGARESADPVVPAPPEAVAALPAGEVAPRRVYRSRVTPRAVRLALVGGLAAFVLAGVGLTLSELVLGRSVGQQSNRTTLLGGERSVSSEPANSEGETGTGAGGQEDDQPAQEPSEEATPPGEEPPAEDPPQPAPETPPSEGQAPPQGSGEGEPAQPPPAQPAPAAPDPGQAQPAPAQPSAPPSTP